MGTLPLAVLASRVRVEEKWILEALERRGIPYQYVDTRLFHTRLTAGPSAPDPVYSAALSREIAQTRALYAVRLLEATGIAAVNSAEAIAVCGDKASTALALVHAAVSTPRTAVALTPEAALHAMEELGYPVVVKPLTGSWGRLAAVVRDEETARTVLEHRAALPAPHQHVIYLQELIDKPDRDVRMVVVGGQVLGAMYRYSTEWRSNIARGAKPRRCAVTPEMADLASAAVAAVDGTADRGVFGVDVIEDREGRMYVLEVNHTVEFQGFQSVHEGVVDVAEAIVEHVHSMMARG